MDFKFRAGDDNPAAKIMSSASNVNCYPRQTMRGPDLMGSSNNDFHIRGLIHREMEKERIRQEIFMEEMARRRVLEAEVRREMAMERDMVMRRAVEMGLPFNERMPMWFPHENRWTLSGVTGYGGCSNVVPPQIPRMSDAVGAEAVEAKPDESNHEKLIVLPRPDLRLSTLKRKAEAPPEVNTDQKPPFGLKKKPKEEWSCALCQISCTNETGFNLHLKGKKHKVREAGLRAHSTTKNINGVASAKGVIKTVGLKTGNEVEKKSVEIEKTDEGSDQTHEELQPSKSKKNKFKHWCELCEVGTTSKKVMIGHEIGKKHIALLNRLKRNGKVVPTTVVAVASAITTTADTVIAAGTTTATTAATGTVEITTTDIGTINTTTIAAKSVPTIANDSPPIFASVFSTTTTAFDTTTTTTAADTATTTAIVADITTTAIVADITTTAIAVDTTVAADTVFAVTSASKEEDLVGN